MIRKISIALTLLFLVNLSGRAQLVSTPERAALHNIQKKKWDRAKGQLRKSMRKDSVNAAAHYVLSLYFFSTDNPEFQIDSAYRSNQNALRNFSLSGSRDRERMKRFPLDSNILIALRERIDSAAFARAKRIHTEEAYLRFLADFRFAAQRHQAEELRDEVAYMDALKENTYQAFYQYILKYPASNRIADATHKYDKLVFESKTKDKRLQSYEAFLLEHPGTPYRKMIEQQIFEIITASGEPQTFRLFLERYPASGLRQKAMNILYHLLDEEVELADTFWTDSIRNVQQLRHRYLVPFMRDGKFGFMDKSGLEIINPVGEEIDESYRCGNIREDIVVMDDRILSRSGAIIFTGTIDAIDDIGGGFITVQSGTCLFTIHKTGFRVGDCAEDVRMLNDRFIAFKKENRWSLYTLAGRMLVSSEWDDIAAIQNVFVFRKGKKSRLITLQDLARVADQQKLKLSDELDEVKGWPHDLIWVKTGEYQGALDQTLEARIRLDKHELHTIPQGVLSKSNAGYIFFTPSGEESLSFPEVRYNETWIAVKKDHWHIFDPIALSTISSAFDTISFTGPFAVAAQKDSIRVYVSAKDYLIFPATFRVEFIPGKDSTSFLMVDDGERKTLYTMRGKKLCTVVYDKIEYAGTGIFIVSKKEKKGLITSDGKPLLPVEYDAIGSVSNTVITVLRSMKFGLFDPVTRKLIKPHYDKNLSRYDQSYITAFKDGFYAFVGWDDKPQSAFEFEEIRYWNDTTALVKRNFQWQFYHIKGKKTILEKIKNYKLIKDTPEEKIAIVSVENSFGVESSVRGEIIPPTFSDIVNLGSQEEPLYFTEKHVEEASIFVVIYYDKDGKLLRRQVCEIEDYERLYCAKP